MLTFDGQIYFSSGRSGSCRAAHRQNLFGMPSDAIFFKKLSEFIFPRYEEYAPLVLTNTLKRPFAGRRKHKFLFILSPPYCGSTLLNELISTSKSVSVNNEVGSREGQTLPTVRKIMFDHQHRWNASHEMDWKKIRKEWMKYWDLTHPVLLEKSPPNLVRAISISKVFTPACFIVFYRNPYAHCESLIRRNKVPPESAAKFALKCLRHQRDNLEGLPNAIPIAYEKLTTEPQKTVDALAERIPELSDLDIGRSFTAHNFRKQESMKIQNLNEDKIRNLSDQQIEAINGIFAGNEELLAFFDYELMTVA